MTNSKRRRGQGVSEYGVGLAIIAAAIIISLSIVSGATGAIFSTISSSIGNVTGPAPSGGPAPTPTATPGVFTPSLQRGGTNLQDPSFNEGYAVWYINFAGGTGPYAYSGTVDSTPVGETGLADGGTGQATLHFFCTSGQPDSHTITITATDADTGSAPLTDTMTFTCGQHFTLDSFSVSPNGGYTSGSPTWSHSYSASASGGTAPYAYAWFDGWYSNDTGLFQFSSSPSGNYAIPCGHMNIQPIVAMNVTDANGNALGSQADVGPCPGGGPGSGGPASPIFSTMVSDPGSIASGGTSTITMRLLDGDGLYLNASGGLGAISNDFGAQNDPNPFSTADNGDGTYTFTVTDGGNFGGSGQVLGFLNGEQLQAQAQVYVAPPTADVNGDNQAESGAAATVNGTGFPVSINVLVTFDPGGQNDTLIGNFNSDPTGAFVQPVSIPGVPTGNYTVTFSVNGTPVVTDSVAVIQAPNYDGDTSSDSAEASAGTDPYDPLSYPGSPPEQVRTFAGALQQFHGGGGLTDGYGTNARFSVTYGVTVAPDGNIWVADPNNQAIRKITPAGLVSSIVIPYAYPDPRNCQNAIADLAADSSGNVYIGCSSYNNIIKVDSGGVVSLVANPLHLFPVGLAINPADGNLYAASAYDPDGSNNPASGRILKIDLSNGNAVSTYATLPDGSILPEALTFDAAGQAYVATSSCQVYTVAAGGGSPTLLSGRGCYLAPDQFSPGHVDGPGASAQFNAVLGGIAVDSVGNVYVADTYNNVIRKIEPDGTTSTFAGDGSGYPTDPVNGPLLSAEFRLPNSIAIDGAGNFYVTDSNVVRKITP